MISIPFHAEYQNRQIKNTKMKITIHSTCMSIMVFMIFLVYFNGMKEEKGGKTNFVEGFEKRGKVWKKDKK